MAFVNSVFPEIRYIHGFKKEIIYPITVVGNGTKEYRVNKSRWDRFSFSFPTHLMKEDKRYEVAGFLAKKYHSLNSFKFKDPTYPLLNGDILVNKTGSKWFLYTAYDTNTGKAHPIFHPGTLSVTVNGSPASYTFAIEEGEPIITVSGSSSGQTVRVSGPYWLAVRLDSTVSWSLEGFVQQDPSLNCYPTPLAVNMGELKLLEVFEY